MKLFSILRKTRVEPRYHRRMGTIRVRVTSIKRTFLGIPYETLYKYRETYHGNTKDCADCVMSRV
jgi:hypothetical protein